MEISIRVPLLTLFFFFFSSSLPGHGVNFVSAQAVDVGVILDLASMGGKRSHTSISMAIDDFYAVHSNYTRRVVLHARDSNGDIVGAASAAVDLIKNAQVQAMIGAHTSSQTEFVTDIGSKAKVPILSFSATSPSLSSTRTPYFVRTTMNDSSQVGAIAAIVKSFGWREVVPIYEDNDYGTGMIPFLVDACQAVDARVPYRSVIPPYPTDDQITAELYKLKTMPTRVFVVHMTALGSRLFTRAAELGMMSKGYAWIVTDGMANTLEQLDADTFEAMQGVIGVRLYVPKTKVVQNFTTRWRTRFRKENPTIYPAEPTVFQLWAYDTAWALALAVEKAGIGSSRFKNPKSGDNSSDLGAIGISQAGPNLLAAIKNTRFHGVAGLFELVDGQLQSNSFEVVNINGEAARRIGFWNPAAGLSQFQQLNSRTSVALPTPAGHLKPVIWPGDTVVTPRGWQIPTSGKRLQIGVPVKDGFNQFVNVEYDPITNSPIVTGYCIDVFDAVMKILPYSVQYDYVPYDTINQTYDSLLDQVLNQKFDAVVGDVTIIANRSKYIDYTLPFTESGVSLSVSVKENKERNIWVFLKPLTTDLWLGTLAFFFFTGFVVWVLEHRINEEFRGPKLQQAGLIFYFSFSTLVFAHKEKLESNLARFTVIIWVFVVLILTSSYTASLTSMLTVKNLQPTVTTLSELLKNGDNVGYQSSSFTQGMLKQMKFDASKLKELRTIDEYADALSIGTKKGGVAAIFDEIPYLKLFLSQRCGDYEMVGPSYKTGGFGFVFPRGSPLVPDVSWAILNVTEGDPMTGIERKWFGDPSTCTNKDNDLGSTRLDFLSFGGLFLITGVVSLLALLIFLANFIYKERNELKMAAMESPLWKRLVAWAKHYDHKDLSSHTFKRDRATASMSGNSTPKYQAGEDAVMPYFSGLQSPVSVSNSYINSKPFEGMSSSEMDSPRMESPLHGTSVDITVVASRN